MTFRNLKPVPSKCANRCLGHTCEYWRAENTTCAELLSIKSRPLFDAMADEHGACDCGVTASDPGACCLVH